MTKTDYDKLLKNIYEKEMMEYALKRYIEYVQENRYEYERGLVEYLMSRLKEVGTER